MCLTWIRKSKWIVIAAMISLTGCGGADNIDSDLSDGQDSTGGGVGEMAGITNVFSMPSEMSVGDVMMVEFNELATANIDFTGTESSAEFILAVGSYATSGSGTSVQLMGNVASKDVSKAAEAVTNNDAELRDDVYGASEVLNAWLRASEDELAYNEEIPEGGVKASLVKSDEIKAVSVGATETFRVLSSLSSMSSYVSVTGEAKCVGTNVVFFLDTSVTSDMISQDEIDLLCDDFDEVAGEELDILGSTSDVDDDGKFHVLMTKQINKLGAMGGGIITGYFYAGDLYARSSSNVTSNEREIIYTMVPDPDGDYGTAISKEFAMSNLMPAVLPHELQHAISYNQHVFENGGLPEENWLNEGMSHLIEDVVGHGMENPSRYAMFLASPSTYGVVTLGSPNLMERGASYLFMRYMYEQATDPNAFLKALEQTSSRGTDNLEEAFDGSEMNTFPQFMVRWVIALAMTDRNITADPRYIYRARTQNSQTGNWEGACIDCDADDNRGTELTGVNLNSYNGYQSVYLDASSASFMDISTLPDSIELNATSSNGIFGVLIRKN